MEKIEAIKADASYQQILKDSFGGVMYNVANRTKYNTDKILKLRNELTANEKECVGGVMKGAMNFIQGK